MNKENVKGPQEVSLESLETRDISGTAKKAASSAWGFQNGGAGLVKTLADKMNNAEAETEFTFRVRPVLDVGSVADGTRARARWAAAECPTERRAQRTLG